MNYLKFVVCALLTGSLFSCTVEETKTKEVENKVTADPLSDDDSLAAREPKMDIVEKNNALQLRADIDEYRQSIENSISELEKGTINLSEARAQNSRDWQKLDYYKSENNVVRIKTYPSKGSGEKTEEFYFIDDNLVFALVEEEGNKNNKIEEESAGQAFYYKNGELIVNKDFEMGEATKADKKQMAEATNRQSEAKDYLQLVYQSME